MDSDCPAPSTIGPLQFDEWESLIQRVVFVSATPGDWELTRSGGVVVEQIIRPTGLVDPEVEVRPVRGQVDDLLAEIRERAARKERVLVTTLTKRMSEDLSGVPPIRGRCESGTCTPTSMSSNAWTS